MQTQSLISILNLSNICFYPQEINQVFFSILKKYTFYQKLFMNYSQKTV